MKESLTFIVCFLIIATLGGLTINGCWHDGDKMKQCAEACKTTGGRMKKIN